MKIVEIEIICKGKIEDNLTFQIEVEDEFNDNLLAIEVNGGYRYYKKWMDAVIDHLKEKNFIDGEFKSEIFEFSGKLKSVGFEIFNFKVTNSKGESLNFPCLSEN